MDVICLDPKIKLSLLTCSYNGLPCPSWSRSIRCTANVRWRPPRKQAGPGTVAPVPPHTPPVGIEAIAHYKRAGLLGAAPHKSFRHGTSKTVLGRTPPKSNGTYRHRAAMEAVGDSWRSPTDFRKTRGQIRTKRPLWTQMKGTRTRGV